MDSIADKTLEQLGVSNLVSYSFRLTELRSAFERDTPNPSDEMSWRTFSDDWLNPNTGILARATKNWMRDVKTDWQNRILFDLKVLRSYIEVHLQVRRSLQLLGVSEAKQIEPLFDQLRERFHHEVQQSVDAVDLGITEVEWRGRKSGALSLIADNWLKPAPPDLKRVIGLQLNQLRALVESTLEERRKTIESASAQAAFAHEQIDLSLPGVTRPIGTRHLISQTYDELYRIFNSIGFSIVEGSEIETPYYNFEALNIPEHHPARDNMDTFYLADAPGYLLRTHTSPMQVRTMEKQKPPVRIVVPGKVYRRDNPDATHSFTFHQLEGLAVDTDITFCDFKGTIEYFARQFFGPQTRVRLRPSYFPFTEPSAEFDASCHVCGGSGCRTCKYSGWIELFGAGMVDPAVYGFVGYDAKRLSGFAFGLGVDRLAMLKYGIDDLQQFFRNDARFLRQFP